MYCSQCATPLSETDVYCPKCSKPIASFTFDEKQVPSVEFVGETETVVRPVAAPTEKQGLKSWIMAGGVAGIVFFVLFLAAIGILAAIFYFVFLAPS